LLDHPCIKSGIWPESHDGDNDVVTMMGISEDPALATAKPEPYQPDICWTLSPYEGAHKLYARVWDYALNPSAVVSSFITLDFTPPTAHIEVPMDVSEDTFLINNSESDNVSGVAYYEIEYRYGNGSWTPWKGHFTHQDTWHWFTGEDGHTYSFRIRAMDNAGNLGQFEEAGNTTTVNILAPTVNITDLHPNDPIRGLFRVIGDAASNYVYRSVHVLIRIDDGVWQNADGTINWRFNINTKALKNGPHTIRAKSYDGLKYSDEAVVPFTVDNRAAEPAVSMENNMAWALLGALILCCAVAWVAFRAMNRKRRGGE
jgi:hypothetical protein